MTPSVPLYARPESFRGQRCTRVRLLAPSGGEADGTGAVAACGNLAARPEDCTRELADSVNPRFLELAEGLEPPTCCLQDSREPSTVYWRVLFLQLRSDSASS